MSFYSLADAIKTPMDKLLCDDIYATPKNNPLKNSQWKWLLFLLLLFY